MKRSVMHSGKTSPLSRTIADDLATVDVDDLGGVAGGANPGQLLPFGGGGGWVPPAEEPVILPVVPDTVRHPELREQPKAAVSGGKPM